MARTGMYTCFVPQTVHFRRGWDHQQVQRELGHIEYYSSFSKVPSFAHEEATILVESSIERQEVRALTKGDYYFTDGRTDIKKPLPLTRIFVVSESSDTEEVIVPDGDIRELKPRDRYLFLEFAHLQLLTLSVHKPEALEQFITAYGFLGGDITRYLKKGETDKEETDLFVGETYFDWLSEILEMRHAIDLWRSLTSRDATKVERFISWKKVGTSDESFYRACLKCPKEAYGEEERFLRGLRSEHWLLWPAAVKDSDRPRVMVPTPDATLEAGWRYLNLWINHGLTGRTDTRLAKITDQGLVLAPEPNCLIGALWQQFANALVGNEALRICPGCGKSFPIKRTVGSRMDKQYCSDLCRVRIHRRRNQKI